ncbi:MAG: signal peptidase I [Planctomycetota bacterium]|jgi:signal peptidase I
MSRKGKRKGGSGDASLEGGGAEEPRPIPGGWLRENLEAIVVAVIMALVIRHFCVEAFKIPTSSMEPTLYGNHPELRIRGDRILVNKFNYKFSEPNRWDVIVFKYPLDKTKNYIKRLVGLPEEEIKIRGGNIYVNREPKDADRKWILARKPRVIQEAIWQEIYPGASEEGPGYWAAESGADFRGSKTGGLLKPRKGDRAFILYRGEIRARRDRKALPQEEAPPLGEIRLSFKAALDQGKLIVHLDLDEMEVHFHVSVGTGEKARIALNGEEVASAETSLSPQRTRSVSIFNVDGRLALCVDGRTLCEHAFDPGEFYTRLMRPRLRIGVSGGGALQLSDITLHRDIHYIMDHRGVLSDQGVLRIPRDCYFVLGDNCTSSKDSRLWKSIRFRLKDGREIEAEWGGDDFVRDEASGELHLLDTNGNPWHLTRSEVENFDAVGDFAPFVARENLIGSAFMVFWPLKRVHLIH